MIFEGEMEKLLFSWWWVRASSAISNSSSSLYLSVGDQISSFLLQANSHDVRNPHKTWSRQKNHYKLQSRFEINEICTKTIREAFFFAIELAKLSSCLVARSFFSVVVWCCHWMIFPFTTHPRRFFSHSEENLYIMYIFGWIEMQMNFTYLPTFSIHCEWEWASKRVPECRWLFSACAIIKSLNFIHKYISLKHTWVHEKERESEAFQFMEKLHAAARLRIVEKVFNSWMWMNVSDDADKSFSSHLLRCYYLNEESENLSRNVVEPSWW